MMAFKRSRRRSPSENVTYRDSTTNGHRGSKYRSSVAAPYGIKRKKSFFGAKAPGFISYKVKTGKNSYATHYHGASHLRPTGIHKRIIKHRRR